MLILRSENLRAGTLDHGFFGRTGGVSRGIFASLNCGPGSGDAREAIVANRARVAEALFADALLTLYQTHSAVAVTVSEPWELGEGPHADAMVTNRPGLALGVLTADCAPVLLADPDHQVVGAAHAGWKGALSGVIESALAAMERLGAKRAHIAAAVGPCISQMNYEVGPEFRERFVAADSANSRFFKPSLRPEHCQFDLEGYVFHRLRLAGVRNIKLLAACTYAREDGFFSFRRATHRGEQDYGRQISAILLRK